MKVDLLTFTLSALALIGATAAVTHFLLKRGRSYTTPRVAMRAKLLTGNELDFFRKLQQAAKEFDVFAQVSQGALLDVTVPANHPLYWASRARFDRKIADLVICRKRDAGVLCLVELDDVTHDFNKDAKRDDLTGQAGLATLRYWSRAKPNVEELRRDILAIAGNS